ncbi:aldo/keto reductase [Emcibacteraceae bacterium]|nr:aldo/keto reductase [Emcibacteraceae bacterium]
MTNNSLIGECKIPAVGMGLWKLDNDIAAKTVRDAIDIGYRHLDSAADYGNEEQVGNGIYAALNEGLCARDNLWITSKLWNTDHRPEHVAKGCERSLNDLRLDYLDLYLIHFPISLKHVPNSKRYPPGWLFDEDIQEMQIDPVPIHETWAAMEELVQSGKVKNIGVCNFTSGLMHDLLSYAKIPPAVLQVESHPYLTQDRLVRMCQQRDIAVTAFSPLAALSYIPMNMAGEGSNVLNEVVVKAAAIRIGRTPAQIVLRWALQRGTAIIPKSSNRNRMTENIALFDFELTANEMAAITALNRNHRFNDPGNFCENGFDTLYPIYD